MVKNKFVKVRILEQNRFFFCVSSSIETRKSKEKEANCKLQNSCVLLTQQLVPFTNCF